MIDPDDARCEALQNRFVESGDPADLTAAIEIGERLVAGEPGSWAAQLLLARSLRMRCELTGDQADLDRAIVLSRRATDPAANVRERAEAFYELGVELRMRATLVGDHAALDAAITVLEAPMVACQDDPQARSRFAADLAWVHRLRYHVSGDPADLDQAIELNAEAVGLLPGDDPALPQRLLELAGRYTDRYQSDTGTPADVRLAEDLAQRSFELTAPESPAVASRLDTLTGILLVRAWHAGRQVDSTTVEELVHRLAAAAPRATPQDRVTARFRLGLLAAAAERHDLAAQQLTLAVHDLPALTSPERRQPEQEIRLVPFRGLVSEAMTAQCAVGDTVAALAVAERGRGVTTGHPDFPSTPAEHLPGAIVIGAGHSRADALVLVPGSLAPVHVPLPGLKAGDVNTRATALLDVLDQPAGLTTTLARARVVGELLTWLWDTTVGPVLEVATAHGLTRVWWLGLGEIGQFPLHAAGYPGEHGALDAVVSSTVPNLRTLDRLRRREPATNRRALVLAMRETPGQPSLPGTAEELTAIPDARVLTDIDATTDNLRTALPDCTWAHFACHATTGQLRADLPSTSALHLHDGLISIADLAGLPPADAELAYLSACATGHSGSALADESTNLATAFHRLGFRHVIASLWPLDDTTAATAARTFYRRMPPTADAGHAPHALREVTRELRANFPDRPDLWAPLIHSGP
ncbi:CHAT domain-containing protein [Amycolatopsis sp. NPDC051106]|uniref:CHAT domain-containing protein n=1 Tax=unclassified Amycolatopsis TaxID=2618356 RepID=UPI0034448BDE